MTFNSSCTFAGLANLLEDYNIAIEDRELALECMVPYIFQYDGQGDSFSTGAMVQDAMYFNHYLRKHNLKLIENKITINEVPNFLTGLKSRAMLGLKMHSGNKHAVIFNGIEDGNFVFLNSRREDSNEPSHYTFNRDELMALLDDYCLIATIRLDDGEQKEGEAAREDNARVFLKEAIENSLATLEQFRDVTIEMMQLEQTPQELLVNREKVFRALFLDAFSMMEILGEHELVRTIGQLRNAYIDGLRLNQPLVLAHHLDHNAFDAVIEQYKGVIRNARP